MYTYTFMHREWMCRDGERNCGCMKERYDDIYPIFSLQTRGLVSTADV